MKLGLGRKRALVTGAGRGIGRAIAISLAKEGVKVAVTSRTRADIEGLVKEMGGAREGHWGFPADLTRAGVPRKLVRAMERSFGRPDIVVHNLGDTLSITDPFCSLFDWRRVWRINVEVAIELNSLLVPPMIEKKWGRIIHIGSTASLENNGPITYCTAKAALVAYSRSLGRVLAPDGVVVSAIIVGAVYTEGGYWEKAIKERPDHVKKYISDRLPLKRFGKPEDIANMTTFLASDLADFCQGAIIPVEGGQSRHYFFQ